MVLVSKENKRKIFEYLLAEGVLVVKKDTYLPKHQNLSDVPNLQVMMIIKSLKSRGFVQEVFCWQWAYYTVTNKGVQFLVKELCKLFFMVNLPCSTPGRHRSRYLQEEARYHRSQSQGRGRRREVKQTRGRGNQSRRPWQRPALSSA